MRYVFYNKVLQTGLLIIITLFQGCVSHYRVYGGMQRPDDQVGALISVSLSEGYNPVQFRSYVSYAVDGLGNEIEIKSDRKDVHPSSIQMLPGQYRVGVLCTVNGRLAKPYLPVKLNKGSVYKVGCESVKKAGKHYVRAVLVSN